MNTQIVKLKGLSYPLKVVRKTDFPADKWAVREVELSDCTIHPKAREVAEILKSQTHVVRWWLYEEIEQPLIVPWKALGYVLGTATLIIGGIALLPFILVGVAIVAALAIDPILVCEIYDPLTGETTCLRCSWWFHSSGK